MPCWRLRGKERSQWTLLFSTGFLWREREGKDRQKNERDRRMFRGAAERVGKKERGRGASALKNEPKIENSG
jgi:hypothetical protein